MKLAALILIFLLEARPIPGTNLQQCVYDYYGTEYIVTISSVQLCPLQIDVPE